MATHLAESQEVDRFLVPSFEIQGGSWPSTAAEALSQQSLAPPLSCRSGNFPFSHMEGSANQSWGPSSINPIGSSSISTYSSNSDGGFSTDTLGGNPSVLPTCEGPEGVEPSPSLPVSLFVNSSSIGSLPGSSLDWSSSEESFPASSVGAQENKSLSAGAGLANLGNTCFINAILQCFTHTAPFVEGLRSANHAMPCNRHGEDFCVLCSIRDHIELSLTSLGGIISPLKLVNNLSYFSSCFRRYQQEDAHEFMQCFLDKLERCLDSKAKDKISSEDDGLVNKVFGGRLISNLCCCNCGHCSETYEPLVDLSLEIENVDSLSSALDSFTKVERIGDPETKFKCESCKEEVLVEKQLKLEKIPLIATFHLKRFKADGSFVEKIEKHVEFPLELDLQPYTLGAQDAEVEFNYELFAIVEHTGFSSTSGHYFSFVRSAPDTWHRMDDSLVTRVSEDYVLSREAYILLYKRKGTLWFSSLIEQQDPCANSDPSNLSPKSVLANIENVCSSFAAETNVNCETTNASADTLGLNSAGFSGEMGDKKTGANDLGNATPANLHIFESATTKSSPVVNENLHSNDKGRCIDSLHPLMPLRSSSPDINTLKTPEPQYRIPIDHLKTEKCTTSGRPLNKGVEDSERKAALRYIKKSMPSSRGSKMIAAILGSQSEGPLNKKRLRSSPCKRSSPPTNRRKTSHNSVMRFVAAEN